jgi:hypothetical protein
MWKRATATAVAALLIGAAPAAAEQPAGGYAPWDGHNPFNCTIQNVGTGTNFPDPGADPFCVEFDKTQQNLTDLGILEFLANEPARTAAAVDKCWYYQSDHWTGSIIQGQDPELWHWDGQYFFDKAIGAGGVNLQNLRFLGQPAAFPPGSLPAEFTPYFDQGGGGAWLVTDLPADPACAAKLAAEGPDAIYAGGQPPVVPAPGGGPGAVPDLSGVPSPAGGVAGKTAKRRDKCRRHRHCRHKHR